MLADRKGGSGEMRNLFRFLSKAGKSGALCTQAD